MSVRAPLGIAIAGCGRIGMVHARLLAGRVPGARLTRVLDDDPLRAADVGARLGVAHGSELDALLDDNAVDAVVIATPPASHAQLVERIAASGRPILCEKPLAHDLADARAAADAAAREGVPLQVGYHRRFDADYAAARELLAAGGLGRVRAFVSSMRDERPPPPARLRGERLLLDAASHDFDCVRWLLGEIVEVASFGRRDHDGPCDEVGEFDHVVTVARTADGALGTIETSRIAGYGFDCRTELIGSDGTVRIDRPHIDAVERRGPGVARRLLPRDFHARFAAAYGAQLECFVRVARGEQEPPVDGDDGVAAVRAALAAEISLQSGGTPVPLRTAAPREPVEALR